MPTEDPASNEKQDCTGRLVYTQLAARPCKLGYLRNRTGETVSVCRRCVRASDLKGGMVMLCLGFVRSTFFSLLEAASNNLKRFVVMKGRGLAPF
jgi:hypothetical protein